MPHRQKRQPQERPPWCDPCAYTPNSSSQAVCLGAKPPDNATLCDDDHLRCGWVAGLNRTISIQWGGRWKVTGWGNSFLVIEGLHALAAMIGRRLELYVHEKAYLPADLIGLNGDVPWGTTPELYMQKPGARAVTDADFAHLAPGGFAAYALKGAAQFVNRSKLKGEMLRHLHEQFGGHPHIYLNLTAPAAHVLMKSYVCPGMSFRFEPCLGRIMSRPLVNGRLAAALAAATARLPKKFISVHVRTLAADMKIPKQSTPDVEATIDMQVWDNNVTRRIYMEELDRWCSASRGALFIASDSRAIIQLFASFCRNTTVVHSGCSIRAHTEKSIDVFVRGASGAPAVAPVGSGLTSGLSPTECTMFDWLMLASSRLVVTWGKQYSSFPKSAREASCRAKRARSPKRHPWDWRPRTFFLRRHIKAEKNMPCNAVRLKGTPCEGLCGDACLLKIDSAYA